MIPVWTEILIVVAGLIVAIVTISVSVAMNRVVKSKSRR